MPMLSLPIRGRKELIERQFPAGSEYALAPLHETRVLGDAKNPRPHLLRLAESIETLKRFEQSLLRHLFGVFPLAAQQPTVSEHLRTEVFHEPIKGAWLSIQQG